MTKPRRKSSETTTRALAWIECQRRGWSFHLASWTERFPVSPSVPGPRWRTVNHDFAGCIDAIAFGSDQPSYREPLRSEPPRRRGTYAIQYTDRSNHAARRRKLLASDAVVDMLQAGWVVLIWSFDTASAQPNPRPHEEEITMGMLDF